MMEQSLFLFIRNHQEVFEAMAELLKRSSLGAETGELPSSDPKQLLFWCGTILASSARKVGKGIHERDTWKNHCFYSH
jgi:hypothetical protein